MLTFTIRRLLISIPTLLFISLIIFLLLNLAPNDPMAQVPLTVPPEVKEKMREALGLGQPLYVQFWKWLVQFFWIEPQVLIDYYFGTTFSEGELRVISWQTRSPVMDMIVQRLPQTLWVVGMSYIVGILIALPIGIYSAYRHYSVFDQAGTFITMVGYSIPPFYDSLIAKLIVYGDDRDKCLARLRRALAEFIVEPIPTTLGLHERLVDAEAVKDGSYNIRWLEEKFLAGDDSGTAE